jgi:hypothetical protein
MEDSIVQEQSYRGAATWRRPFWLMLLVAASVLFSLGFACAAPFAALCAVAACTAPRRDAYAVAAVVWLANQVVGFTFLQYPWTVTCVAWGAAIGLSALLCTLAARWTSQRLLGLPPWVASGLAFVAAFVAFEGALLAFSLPLGGTESFTPAIVARIFAINTVAAVGFFALNRVGVVIGIANPSPSLSRG